MTQNYSTAELWLMGFALSISGVLLFVGEPPQIAAVPSFLAWLSLNRKSSN